MEEVFPGFDSAIPLEVGNSFDDFEVNQSFEHHLGRTLNIGDNTLFSTLTLCLNPLYFNDEYAKENGHEQTPINPLLVFNTVFGMSVEDLSEKGGPFLGIDDLVFHENVYSGDTLRARSTVLNKRISKSNEEVGIVTWHTEGFNQRGSLVVEYKRSNIVAKSGFQAKF